jgi:hypothetical protein
MAFDMSLMALYKVNIWSFGEREGRVSARSRLLVKVGGSPLEAGCSHSISVTGIFRNVATGCSPGRL